MKVRAQIGMVLNLDKCIGCHTCSITCKNVWTRGRAWNTPGSTTSKPNPVLVIPKNGKTRTNGRVAGSAHRKASYSPSGQAPGTGEHICQPDLPTIDEYYEPFDFDYQHLHNARRTASISRWRVHAR